MKKVATDIIVSQNGNLVLLSPTAKSTDEAGAAAAVATPEQPKQQSQYSRR